MVFRQRRDGTHLGQIQPLRRIVPYLMRTRAEGTVYFPQRIEVDDLLAWLAEVNAGRPRSEQVTLFHVCLTAIARTLKLRPETNRFVVGRRTYQHKEISISFVVKAAMNDDAPETEARLVFTGDETVEDVRRLVTTSLLRERGPEEGSDDRLVRFFAAWPRPVLNLVSGSIRRLDYHNALPAPLMDAIPLYTSVYVVNAGSIGIDPPFHHLYEFGSSSAFVAIGRVSREPAVDEHDRIVPRSFLGLVYTLDERATDGFYFAKTAEVIRRLVAEPALLADPTITVDDIVPVWPPRR